MPRGVKKDSGDKKTAKIVEKARKPYPSRDERIKMAQVKLAKLEKLADDRRKLVKKTEELAQKRRDALESAEKQIIAVNARLDRLSSHTEAKKKGVRLTKKVKNENMAKLEAAVAASGKSIDEILAAIERA